MSNKTGRNEPCPCGSGKKFKHCCGAPGASAAPPPSAQTAPLGAVSNAVKYVSSPDWEAEAERAFHAYVDALAEVGIEEFDAILADDPFLAEIFHTHFVEWLLSDYEDASGHNPIEDYLARNGWRENERGRSWLQGLRDHRMSLYEAREVTPGEGMTLRDALRGGAPIAVYERSGTQSLHRWDYIATRIVPFEGRNLLAGSCLHIPRDLALELIDELRIDRREFPDWEAFLHTTAPMFMAGYLDRFVHPPPLPELRTSDGDPLCFAKLRFSYSTEIRAQVLAALEAHPEFERSEGGFDWLERKQGEQGKSDGGRILGTIQLEALEGRLETQSKPRLERGSELLRSILPAAVKYRFPVYEDAWQAVSNRPAGEAPPPVDIPAEEMQTIIKQALDRQYANCCDEPIPALDGKTPREAVETDAGRREVIQLLKDYENSDARLPPEQQYDYGWMWETLGLDRDETADTSLDSEVPEEEISGSRAIIMEIIEKQKKDNDPPETRQTYERLLKAGHTHDDAMNLIGCVLLSEINDVVRYQREFDNDEYVRMLHDLPRPPWDDEE